MNALVGLETCTTKGKYIERAKLCAETWGAELPKYGFTFKAFTGEILGVNDDYKHLCYKTRAICKYAVENSYDWLLIIDDDCVLRPEKLHVPDFDGRVDYAGYSLPRGVNKLTQRLYLSGGCYWLSKKAFSILAESPISATPGIMPRPKPGWETWQGTWAEDQWAGWTLGDHGIQPTEMLDWRIAPCTCGHPNCVPERVGNDWTVLMQITDIKTQREIINAFRV